MASASFKGQAEYSVDSKGRVALPAKMRRVVRPEANDTFVMTRGFEQCVFLYPSDRWEEIEEDMDLLNPYQREARSYIRLIMQWAEDVTLDGQGRIGLTKELLEFAGITPGQKVKVLGARDHIEVWDPEKLDAYYEKESMNYESLAESVMGEIRSKRTNQEMIKLGGDGESG